MNDNLPPLPPFAPEFKPRWATDPGGYTAEQMKAYARAAIERQSVPADRVIECAKRLVQHADFQLGGALSADSKPKEIPSNAVSKVKARHLAALRDSLAAAPQPQPVQPTANSGDAEKAELDRMAKYVSTITQSEIDEADGDRGIPKDAPSNSARIGCALGARWS